MFRICYIIIKQETHNHNFTLVGADLLAREKIFAIIFSKGVKGEGLGNSTPKFALTEPEKC